MFESVLTIVTILINRYLQRLCKMHKVVAKLRQCKPAKDSWRYHNSHLSLFGSFTTFSTLNNPIQRHPLAKSELKHNNSLEFHHLSNVLQECADSGDFRAGMSVHTLLMKLFYNGFTSLWNKLLNLYNKCGQCGIARHLFDTMPERDVVSFNIMISACVRNNSAFEAICLYSRMRDDNAMPNHITLARLIGACEGLGAVQLREVFHAQAIRYGLCSNEYVGSSLVDGYSKQMRLEDAIRAFGDISELDLVSWNIMIDGCVRNNSKEHALRMFSWMLQENLGFDGFTVTSIIKTCSEPKDLNRGMLLHGCAIKSGFSHETPVSNALITMYSRCEEGMVSATKLFGGVLAPNIISWTAMMSGFMQNGENLEAIVFYQNMLRVGMKENDFSFSCILPVYSNLGNLEHGRQIHARIVKSWYGADLSVNNALIDMYSKCGSLKEAHLVFRTMEKHDKVSCTTMITGFGQHGKGREALEILDKMTKQGLNPDDITFLGCLSACSHGGYVDEGIWVFRIMIDVHNLKPRREHFSCIVDMLGRAGRLNEAERFIEEMGIESDVFVWETLLGACRLHGDMGLAEKSVKKIIELQPEKHGPYVLLANMYADRGLWEDKGLVRENLVMGGLNKEAGCSWVAY
ncbi:pentatricopeptide repeat-containing protein At1g11290, chloroplastic-like [Cornus florida]|uniref:pentatricopeptide repeat-containing protein At1g11290, chloroplastic-like n=1 Tax=Cornus florida TaxID=4283 RepID=UPI00289C58E2|nr:pentatricopeptide repeat-containing protein At1g11290, chloroplastic-like [Cornus florida]XP_059671140.1 pentatricopeptide repeat-containing protein At1g11290, chloroplastic-like [Cornus florida]